MRCASGTASNRVIDSIVVCTKLTARLRKQPGGFYFEARSHRLIGGTCLGSIGRELGVSPHTTTRPCQIERLVGTRSLTRETPGCPSTNTLGPAGTDPSESLVFDGFRVFEHSHDLHFDLKLLIGSSHFVYGIGRGGAATRWLGPVVPEVGNTAIDPQRS